MYMQESALPVRSKKRECKTDINDFITAFLENGFESAEVIDDEHEFLDNNNLRRAFQYCIVKHKLKCRVLMRQGRVYVVRK